ncbi:MAG: glycosyltransferase family 4 protein [Candidatus Aminicenantes bacterium]|nr:glycosyltransferase family 4 protein [Candidatus Aminicenantes bacterium]
MIRKGLFQLLRADLALPGETNNDTLAQDIRSTLRADPGPEAAAVLKRICREIARRSGVQAAVNLLNRLEVAFGFRKPALAIYDHTLHLIGGAQKYGCTIAHALQNDFVVTLISNKPVSHDQLRDWYRLDLSRCRIAVIPIPFYEKQGREHLDPAAITSRRIANPFHLISRESGRYDFFINNSMVEMVYPLAGCSLFICHFPERRPSTYFYVDRYPHLIYNSRYTAEWIRKKWGLSPGIHLYPPVDMDGPVDFSAKEDVILSAARFDPGGNKQQLRMVQVFTQLAQRQPRRLQGWKLILAGGSPNDNPYLEKIRQRIAGDRLENVELRINIPAAELKTLYQKAKIFWHLCGLQQNEPELVEHFGMTTAEAMQNGCVPVVFAGGGLKEIVEDGISGLLFSSANQLSRQTLRLIDEPQRLRSMGEAACKRGKVFNRAVFTARVKEIFSALLRDYRMDQ